MSRQIPRRSVLLASVPFAALISILGDSFAGFRVDAEPVSQPEARGVARQPEITADDRRHWAFVPPTRPAVPQVTHSAWVRNPIDAFVLKRLEQAKLHPVREADRATLLRRLSFDLTGLPPRPEDVEAFLGDPASDAYERVVDRLLDSPQFGVRWAQHWLDLARYADSDGFEFDQARENAWRYRDWVVRALNHDMPYDEFVEKQLAGDETDPDDPSAFIATGFNRCYPDMVDLNDQGLRRQNALNDITETTGLAFLGLTIGCARCHDHKFDPIRQSDFYRLQAFFSPARFRDDFTVAAAKDRAEFDRKLEVWKRDLADVQAALIRLEAPVREAFAPGPPPGQNDEVVAAFQKREVERSPNEVRLVSDALAKDRRFPTRAWEVVLDPTSLTIRSLLRGRARALVRSAPRPLPTARGLEETTTTPPPTYLLRRGDYALKGPEVTQGFPVVLCPSRDESTPRVTPTSTSSGRRRALAEWLVRADHPLTARVIINRLWQHHFGRGIVATPSDFGTMGSEPTHPELLDWLARELIDRRWSLKAMHRLMVTSATYRLSDQPDPSCLASDPENSLLWRQRRKRLDGEAIRDALLAAAGLLNDALDGPPVFPKLPGELVKVSSKGTVWPVSANLPDRNRRSLYIFVRRNLRYPFFEAFDRPDTNASCPQRPVTTIAPQALTLLNGELAAECARALADRSRLEAGPEFGAQIGRVYLLAFGRSPDADERRIAQDFLRRDPSLERYCLAIINTNEFIYIE